MKPGFRLKYLYKWVIGLINYHRLKNDLILVYTMGKVGSTTVYRTMKHKFPLNHIYHIHYLSDYYLKEVLPKTRRFEQISIGNDVHKILNKNRGFRKKIITVVRDPIAMGLSHLFEVPDDFTGSADITELSIEKVKEVFKDFKHNYSLEWFDKEFREYTNVDIYAFSFDKEKGYSIYQTKDWDILVIKLEAFNDVLLDSLNEFLSIDLNRIIHSNLTFKKDKGSLQNQVKSEWKGDQERLVEIYDSKYCRHFYTEDEMEGFIARWSGGPGSVKK